MSTQYKVAGIGNAIMDIIAPVEDSLLAREAIDKGSMALIDRTRANHLTEIFANETEGFKEAAGGSGANTLAGIAALGVSAAYMGKVAADALGERFAASMKDGGVDMHSVPLDGGPEDTARCLIAVTADGERSMSTYLGANMLFGESDIDAEIIKAAETIYLEGYLFDSPAQKAAFIKSAEIARAAGRSTALTLSDAFCVDRHRGAFRDMVDNHIDLLFANESELLSLYETTDFEDALARVSAANTVAAITRGEKGSIILAAGERFEIAAAPAAKVIDTTGAGDQYAAGVLAARAKGCSWANAGRQGSLCAAEIISHYGARPERPIETVW